MKIIFLIFILFILNVKLYSFDNNNFYNHNPCKLLKNFPSTIDSIKKYAKFWIHGDDSCVLKLTDIITEFFIKDKTRIYIESLNNVAEYSDGYVSEALVYSCSKILKNCFKQFIIFLSDYKKTNKNPSFLERFVIEALFYDYELDSNYNFGFDKLSKIINKKVLSNDFTKNESEYIKYLLQKVKKYNDNSH